MSARGTGFTLTEWSGVTAIIVVTVVVVATGALAGTAGPLPDRWILVNNWLVSDADVDRIREVVTVGADHGMNGIVLDAGLDCLDTLPPERIERLAKVRGICEERGVEIVPLILSVGYGHAALRSDRNFAEGLPVEDALYVVEGDTARLQPNPAVMFPGGDMERADPAGEITGLSFQESPGRVTFPDRDVSHAEEGSLRIEISRDDNPAGKGRISADIAVRKRAQYRLSFWFRAEGLQPAGALQACIYGGEGEIDQLVPASGPDVGWTSAVFSFNSLGNSSLAVWLGLWGAESGTVWIDDVRFEEIGLRRVVRREGTPLVVRGEGGRVYSEGRDYAPVSDPLAADPSGDGDDVALRLLNGGAIRPGEQLRLSFYHAAVLSRKMQTPLCMSNPALYEHWAEQVERIRQTLNPRSFFLDMDEIRAGGSCASCKARGLTMGQILGDCLTRQVAILRAARPDANVYVWSDMLDPSHNAHGRFYLVDGDFAGSWEAAPKDLVVACWGDPKALEFFSTAGFPTAAMPGMDGGDLAAARGWVEALSRTRMPRGAAYVTWNADYQSLPAFGDLLSAAFPL